MRGSAFSGFFIQSVIFANAASRVALSGHSIQEKTTVSSSVALTAL
jgi:hypothetical protein